MGWGWGGVGGWEGGSGVSRGGAASAAPRACQRGPAARRGAQAGGRHSGAVAARAGPAGWLRRPARRQQTGCQNRQIKINSIENNLINQHFRCCGPPVHMIHCVGLGPVPAALCEAAPLRLQRGRGCRGRGPGRGRAGSKLAGAALLWHIGLAGSAELGANSSRQRLASAGQDRRRCAFWVAT